MIQEGNTPKENYILNSQLLQKIRPGDVDTIFLGHVHADHCANIPALYKAGRCNARIIVPKGSIGLLEEMWLDSARINMRDADFLSRVTGKNVLPMYTEEDAFNTLDYVDEYQSHEIIELDKNLSFRYTPAGHILCSQQTEIFIKQSNHIKKILFTSDLGNTTIESNKIFVEPFEAIANANIVIGECTYAARQRGMTKKTLEKDMQKIETVINQFCIEGNKRVLIPTFSLDRTPYILWILYSIYGKDENFKIPVVIDSPLAIRLLNRYGSILKGDLKEKFEAMMSWKNIQFVVSPNDSKAAVADKGTKIIISSSGMLTAGRSVNWVESILPREEDCILFIGYCSTNSLAHTIKFGDEKRTININQKAIRNRCQIVDLHSFSSHMQREQLINYYKSINCEKIYLVHGDNKAKLEFKQDLEEAISDCSKSHRVIAVNRSTKITL